MKTLTFITDKPILKKHVVRYDTSDSTSPVRTIYVDKDAIGLPIPKQVKITIEEL